MKSIQAEVSSEIREDVARRKLELRRITETSTLCEVPFQLEISVSPAFRDSYGSSPTEVELLAVSVWGVDIPLPSIPADIKDALMEGLS
jgi:hypothetical protein